MPSETIMFNKTGGGGTAVQSRERSIPYDRSTSRSSRQCRCPYCGGCFGLEDDGRFESRVTEYDCQCARCGHAWKSRVAEPIKCPSCGVTGWRYKPESCRCIRCTHEWTSRGKERKPVMCPRCKSKYWNGAPDKTIAVMSSVEASEIVRWKWILKKYNTGKGCLEIASETGIALFEVIQLLRERAGDLKPKLRRLLPIADCNLDAVSHFCRDCWKIHPNSFP